MRRNKWGKEEKMKKKEEEEPASLEVSRALNKSQNLASIVLGSTFLLSETHPESRHHKYI